MAEARRIYWENEPREDEFRGGYGNPALRILFQQIEEAEHVDDEDPVTVHVE